MAECVHKAKAAAGRPRETSARTMIGRSPVAAQGVWWGRTSPCRGEAGQEGPTLARGPELVEVISRSGRIGTAAKRRPAGRGREIPRRRIAAAMQRVAKVSIVETAARALEAGGSSPTAG